MRPSGVYYGFVNGPLKKFVTKFLICGNCWDRDTRETITYVRLLFGVATGAGVYGARSANLSRGERAASVNVRFCVRSRVRSPGVNNSFEPVTIATSISV